MAQPSPEEAASARSLVIGPAVLVSAIFLATVIATVAMAGDWSAISGSLVIGGTCFAAAIVILVAQGLRHVSRLERLGVTDSLTGLPNRNAFHQDFRRLMRHDEEMAVALLDLDGFMLVNEHYGHQIGDRAIRESAAAFLTVCGAEAALYRLGGDEFALLKSGPLAATLVEGMCRRIVDRMARPVLVDDRRLTLGASVGLARRSSGDDTNSSELLRRADVAMYSSKRGGKARCTWYSPEFDRSREAIRALDDELRQGLANDEFTLHYQPLVDCTTREVVAVESLIRWERPDGKPVGPNVFIPVAEESGLINPLGLWVLRRACTDALAWDGIKLSVNISAAQLRNPEFPVQLGHILEETGFDPERLELEITETCLVLDPIVAERSLAVIRGFGVSVALDDFGTGYASFGFLRQFRFEKLKLDRSLVIQAGEDDGSRAMMLSSITVARAMKMAVTAEGVETQEQADMVRAAGCDQIQGWLYFKAMPAADIAAHLGKALDPGIRVAAERGPVQLAAGPVAA